MKRQANNKSVFIEKTLIKIFSLIFKIKDKKKIINMKKNNFKNWDSLNHIKLMVCIENEFNIKFGAKKFNEVDSFKKILYFLGRKQKI